LHRQLPLDTLLRHPHNMANRDNMLQKASAALSRRLPPGWRLRAVMRAQTRPLPSRAVDAAFDLIAPDGRKGRLFLDVRSRLDPRTAQQLVLARSADAPGPAVVMVSPYLSETTQARLRAGELGYLDLTGNARIVLPEPGLFIETTGATEDPDRVARPSRSLRGPKAGRIVRALVDRRSPPGVRELGALTGIDPGYVSRVARHAGGPRPDRARRLACAPAPLGEGRSARGAR
jgi:hypothetical protein